MTARGLNPVFSPDGKKLLILKNDGLHLYDVRNYLEPKHVGLVVKTTGGRASLTMKINVSPDYKMLSWSSPGRGVVDIARIPSWETFSLIPLRTIDRKAYWAVFSPDSRYIALEEIREKEGVEYPVIFVHDIESGSYRRILNMTKYSKNYLWFNAWVN